MSLKNNILFKWFAGMAKTFRREFTLAFKDHGVVLFFVLLPVFYPAVYALIYNPEIARDVPMVVVDESRSSLSRAYARAMDASQFVEIIDHEANMADAKQRMYNKDCYGVLYIPRDFETSLMRGEQVHVSLYCDMSLMLRYKGALISLTEVAQKASAEVSRNNFNNIAISYVPSGLAKPIESEAVALGNEKQGLATAIMPGVLIMIIHQSLLLGVMMLGVGVRERRRRNEHDYDPISVTAYPSATVIGKALCYTVIYILPSIYVLRFVPIMFDFPQLGDEFEIAWMMLPYLLSISFMGLSLQIWLREREDVFPAFVFSSIIFIFLAGVTWPRFAMSDIWVAIGDLIPGTWGVNAYVTMCMNGASLSDQSHSYEMLWVLTGLYFVTAYLVERFSRRKYNRLFENK